MGPGGGPTPLAHRLHPAGAMIGKLIRWGVVLGVLVWLGSVTVAGVVRYLELNDVVERVVVDARPPGGGPVTDERGYARKIRAHVLGQASRPDAPLDDDAVLVSTGAGRLQVTVRWSQPVVTYNGQTMWAVPLSLTRTFANTL
jgi:hypothetical protein